MNRYERIKVSFDCGNILDFLHLAEKTRPPDPEKLKWADAKQVIFFMWPNSQSHVRFRF
jgi:hypothetical protein